MGLLLDAPPSHCYIYGVGLPATLLTLDASPSQNLDTLMGGGMGGFPHSAHTHATDLVK